MTSDSPPRRHPWLPAFALSALLAAACSGDGSGGAERCILLARGFRPRALPATTAVELADRGGDAALSFSPDPSGAGLWLEHHLPRAAWNKLELGAEGLELWCAPRATLDAGSAPDGGPSERLHNSARVFEKIEVASAIFGAEPVSAGRFAAEGDRVYAVVEAGGGGPGDALFSQYLSSGEAHDGFWQVAVGGCSGDGFLVMPGLAEEVRCDVPPGSALIFATTTMALTPGAGSGGPQTIEFSVLLDGVSVVRGSQEVGVPAASRRQRVSLPPEGKRGARLSFQVTGPPALCAFHGPVIAPASELGGAPARSKDIVLFVADTFRADNLAVYGGDEVLTPSLNRLAEESLAFVDACSNASWTLPSHATLFSGLHPYECGVVAMGDRLPAEAETIAEELRRAGYRTGAITDAFFVSRRYGMAQGFEWFHEGFEGLESTLARIDEFLAADDGRPIFLFVHTYRTHGPYAVAHDTRERLSAALPFAPVELALEAEAPPESLDGWAPEYTPSPELARKLRGFEALYRGSASELDQGFARVRASLEHSGVLPGAALVFTSDHGEAFWEHGLWGHGNGLWRENLEIPLLIHGPGIRPRRIEHAASLVDLPRTLAALAGIPPVPHWGGTNLLELSTDRPLVSFECNMGGYASRLCVIDGTRKVFLPADPAAVERRELVSAFDLAADPAERADALAAGARWPLEVFGRAAPLLRSALAPRLSAEAVQLSAEDRARLRALGYGGD